MEIKAPAVKCRGTRVLLWTGVWLLLWAANSYAFDQHSDLRFQRILEGSEAIKNHASALTSITQDRTGFMWFGGENGLSRFDGVHFKRYEQSNRSGALPSNHVRDLATDRQGVMWVATDRGLGRYRPQTDRFDLYKPDHTRPNALPHNVVTSIAVDRHNNLVLGTGSGISIFLSDRSGFSNYPLSSDSKNPTFVYKTFVDSKSRIWVGSRDNGLYLLSDEGQVIRHFRANPADPMALQSNTIKTIEEDQFGRIWVGTYGGGLSRIREGERDFINYSHDPLRPGTIGSNTIWDIYLDSDEQLWVSTDQGGLALYQQETDSFRHFRASMHDRFTLTSNQVRTIFEDRDRNLWIASFPNGINFFDRTHSQVTNYSHKPGDLNSLSNSAVLDFLQTADGILWIGTEKGLNQFDIDSRRFIGRYASKAGDKNSLQANSILSLEEDHSGEIWVGTWSGGLHRFNRITQTFSHYGPNQTGAGYINSAFIWDIFLDSQNTLWVGTETGGLNRYERDSDSFTAFVHEPADSTSIASNFVWSVLEDSRGQFWVATADGLDLMDRQTETFRHMSNPQGGPETIASVRARSLYEDRKGRIWVGTQDVGPYVYDPNSQTFTHVQWPNSLSPLVTSFIEDNLDYVWASTANGIARIDPHTLAVRSFHKGHGLVGDNFNRDATFKDSNGYLYFGGTEGFSVLDPRAFAGDQSDYPLVLTDFKIFNKSVAAGEDGPLHQAITYAEQIQLQHSHSMFSFEFSVLNYHSPFEHRYAYKLEGFDRQWHEVGSEHGATYTNIDPGSYTFKVRSSDRDGVWSKQAAQVQLKVAPPLWLSSWALSAYAALALTVVLLVVIGLRRYLKHAQKLATRAHLAQLQRDKIASLAATAQQLHVPVNRMTDLAEAMLHDSGEQLGPEAESRAALITAHGKRLVNLLNNVIDCEKTAEDTTELNIEAVNIYAQVEGCLALLQPLVMDCKIKLSNRMSPDCPRVAADPHHLRRVILTLLSSAVSTADKGELIITAHVEQGQLLVQINSSGQLDVVNPGVDADVQRGTEISHCQMHLSEHLLKRCGGNLYSKTEPGDEENAAASCLGFTLPLADQQPRLERELAARPFAKIDSSAAANDSASQTSMEARPMSQLAAPIQAQQYRILIVDDDPINRMVLNGILGLHNYTVLEAGSGVEALNMVLQEGRPVDMVILDIMMPRMSGLDVCARLRESYGKDVLPIMFLTAKHSEEDIRKGLEVGGNEVLYKPVNKELLLPRVKAYLLACADHRKLS